MPHLLYCDRRYTIVDMDNELVPIDLERALQGGGLLWLDTKEKGRIALGFPVAGPVVYYPDSATEGDDKEERRGVVL